MLFAKDHISPEDKHTTIFSHLNYKRMCANFIANAHSITQDNLCDTSKCIYVYNLRNSWDATCEHVNDLTDIIDISIINRAINGKALIILSQAHEFHSVTYTGMEKIYTLFDKYKIPLSQLIFLSNNSEREPVIGNVNGIKICKFNYFEQAVKYSIKQIDIHTSHKRRITNIHTESDIKRFLCLNRQPKDSRYETVFSLWKYNILPNTLCSLQMFNENDTLYTLPHTEKLFKQPEFQKFTKVLPLSADNAKLKFNQWDTYNSNFIENVGINIITETLVHHCFASSVFFTEKIYKCMLYSMPFITVAQPNFLTFLKRCGYRTFSSFWDESYDGVIDWSDRLRYLINTLKYLNELSVTEFNSILRSAIPITTHNYIHMMKSNSDSFIFKLLYDAYSEL